MPTGARSAARGERADVVVIGSGVGGLCSAALLARAGRRVVVLEKEGQIGGRASTDTVDGFLIGAGAVAIERHGAMERVFDAVGAPFGVLTPERGVVLRVGGRDIETTSRIGGTVYDRLLRPLFATSARRLERDRALDGRDPSLREWLARRTGNARAHRIARNIAAGFYALNSDEIPARILLHYLASHSAFREIGFHPEGTIGPLRSLVRAVERDGGEVHVSTAAESIVVADGRATAVTARTARGAIRIDCEHVICNAGPEVAVDLCGRAVVAPAYAEEIRRRVVSAPMFAINFASRRPLTGDGAILFFADTERVCAVSHVTSVGPGMAPPGWYLHVASAVPVPALGAFDEETERERALEELTVHLDGFADSQLLSAPLAWPVKVLPGEELGPTTPIDNLWNVGDAVRGYAEIGMQGCAASALDVAQRVLSARPVDGALPASERRTEPLLR